MFQKEKKKYKRIKKKHEVDKDSWGKEMPTRRPFFTWRNINACVLFLHKSVIVFSFTFVVVHVFIFTFFAVLFSSTESSFYQKYIKLISRFTNYRINFILLINLRNIRIIFVSLKHDLIFDRWVNNRNKVFFVCTFQYIYIYFWWYTKYRKT